MKKFFTKLILFLVESTVVFLALLLLGYISKIIALITPLKFATDITLICVCITVAFHLIVKVGKWMLKD